jgi:hypothetical protein
MKRMGFLPVVMLVAVIFAAQPVGAIGLGMPFGFGHNTTFGAHDGRFWGSDIGLRMHFTDVVAVQPAISMSFADEQTNIGLNVDALFYLFESNDIKQYIGANVGLNIADDTDFRFGGIYGLQHPLTGSVDLFGQIGFGVRFEPGRFYTVNTQVGLIFYIAR